LAVVALSLTWVGSASAISISLSFTDLVPGADIVVDGVPGLNGIPSLPIGVPVSVVTSPELATVTVGTQTATSTTTSVGLREPGTSLLSDRVTLQVFSLNTLPVGFQVAFESDAETPLSGTGLIDETGLPQLALQSSLTIPIAGSIDLTVNLQSDLENGGSTVPEPSTLLLFGSSVVGMSGALWRRYRHS
jgi:hypothetical protein